jgi:hypothetical protein
MVEYLAIICGKNKDVGTIFPYDAKNKIDAEILENLEDKEITGQLEIVYKGQDLAKAKESISGVMPLTKIVERLYYNNSF